MVESLRRILTLLTLLSISYLSYSQSIITTFPHKTGFEDGFNGWRNDYNDDFDWIPDAGGTPSTNTGPSSAFEGSNFLYTETTSSGTQFGGCPGISGGDSAIVLSPVYFFPSNSRPFISLRYHMYTTQSSEMGSLRVQARQLSSSSWTTVSDTLIGNQGNSWQLWGVDLGAFAGDTVQLRILAITGSTSGFGDNNGDRAIDDITVGTGIDAEMVSCAGDNDGSATVLYYGSGTPTYLWSNASTSQTQSNLSAGTYSVTIGVNSTTYVSTVEITEPAVPSAPSISASSTAICSNNLGSVDLEVGFPDNPETYSYLSEDEVTNVTSGSVGFTADNAPIHPVSDMTVKFYYMGDLDDPTSGGGQEEFVQLEDENSNVVLDSLISACQCFRNFDTAVITFPDSVVMDWAADGEIDFVGDAQGGVNVSCLSHGYVMRGVLELSYEYSDYYPYWFTTPCPTSTATAIDSGYTLTVSPSTTTTYYVRYFDASCGSFSDCDSVTITVAPPPNVSVSPANPFYCSTPVALTASGASTYAWSPGTGLNTNSGATVQASPASSTTYQVIGTDANSCSDTTSVTVTVTSGPSASISSTNVSCNGGSNGTATVTASGGTGTYTYLWSNTQTTATATNLTAGTYTVTVSDGTNCTATQSVTITEPTALDVTLSVFNALCNGGSSGQITAVPSGGTGSKTYLWSTTQTSQTITNLSAGTYIVTVTDANGCTVVDSATIAQPTALSGGIDTSTNVSCFGGSNGSATAFATGGTSPYNYSWTGGGGNGQTASNLSAGTYFVFISDANGCSTGPYMVQITQPASAVTVSISSSTNVTCNGGSDGSATASGSGGTGTITYAWSGGGGTSATASGLSAGTYTVTATDENGCTATANVTLTQPTVVSATFSNTNVSCNGGSDGASTATGTGGNGGAYSFVWSGGGGSSATASGLSAGTYTVTVTDNAGCTGTASTTITEPAALVASISTNQNVSCNGGSDGSATASGSGGTSPYTYAWSGGGGSAATATGLSAGTYTVTVTDANGCTDTETVTITQPASPLSASISLNQNVSCNGGSDGSATASGSGGTSPYSFAWSGGGGTSATASSLSAGTYTVTVTDANGCTDTESITITQPATAVSVSISLGQNVSCNGGSDGSATASASGGTSGYTYAWSGGGGSSATATGLSAGTYTVTATDANGCTDTESITITEPTALVASISLNQNVSCNGGADGSATASASGGTSGYSYAWSGGGGSSATATGLSAGTYTVTVTDANGCTDTESITITQPTAVVASISLNQNVSCNGGSDGSATASGSGGTSPYTYAWSGGGGSSATATGLAAGTYTVTVTDANGCTDTENITITQPATAVSASIALGQNVSCNGGSDGSATASGSGGTSPYSYAWSGGGGSSATATGLSAGTYTVTVTDNNGCTDTESITITQPASAVSVSISLNQNVSCNGGSDGSATASGSGGTSPYSYAWSGGGGSSATASTLSAGTYTVTITDANGCTDTETITITEPSALVASISLNQNVSCNGGADGSATASASGGTSGYSYAWSGGGGSSATATGLSAGTYTVTVTDANGCTDTESITITQPTAVAASISVNQNVSCNGGSDGSATASGSGGTSPYTYAWSGGGGSSATATGLSAGTYTVTVTDANGCTDTESITITQPASALSASIALGQNVSCNGGSDGSATASGSGGTSPYSYAWSGGGGSSATATGLSAGTYTVTVTDANGCTDTESITITQPASALSASIALGQNVSCNGGSDGSATASGSGGTSPYSYAWSGGAGSSATATGLAAGTYTVTVTDANGCTDTESITITQPSALIASTSVNQNVSCNGGSDGSATASGSGGTSPYTYAWSGGGGSSATATGLAAGTYTVTVTDANGCTDTETATITQPTSVVASITVNQNVSCNGGSDGSATASGSGGTSPYTYAWSGGGGSSATATGLAAGTYTVTVTDANGCTDTETVTITEPSSALTASISLGQNVSCTGGSDGSATASGSGGTSPYSYAWSGGAGSSATATGLSAGTYTVTVTDANGCTDTESITITQPATAVDVSAVVNQNVSCNGGSDGSATATGSGGTSPYSYAWSGGGGSSATASSLSAGTYVVTVTDANGCIDSASVTITEPSVLVASITLGQNVSCNGGSDGAATASGSGGTSPYSYAWSGGAGSSASASGLAAGTYTVTVTDANGCTDTESITITEPTLLVATASLDSAVSCNGDSDGQASATVSGGTSPYTYAWSGGGGSSATATGLSAGNYTVTVTDANGCTDTGNVTVTEPSALTASIASSSNISCFGLFNGSATAAGSGGTPPYSYAWSSGASTATASGLGAGTFTCTVTDANGCTATTTVTITQPTQLVASISLGQNVSCNGGTDGSATASGAGGTSPYSYAWSGGAGSGATASSLSAGTYTVTVTDANGCTDTESITITQPSALVASASMTASVSCNGGSDGQASASGSGGTTPYAYAWSSSANTSSTETGLSAGTYIVTITDANGCEDTAHVTITEPAVLSVSMSSTNVTCNGAANGTATAAPSGGTSPYSYLWSTAQTTSTATNLSPGTYTVTVTDANGCTVTGSATVTQPVVLSASITVANNALCNGSSDGTAYVVGSGGTMPYSYSWSNSSTTDTASNLSAGTVSVTITDANGCTINASATITEPTVLVASANWINDALCYGSSTGNAFASQTGGTSPYSYLWNTGGTNDSLLNVPAGTYWVTITDANGCEDIDTVEIDEPDSISTTASITDVSCNGGSDGSISMSVSGGTSAYTYLWTGGATTSGITGLSSGTYGLTVTDANGCIATYSYFVDEPSALSVSITTINNVSCNGGSDGTAVASASGGVSPYSYSWSSSSSTDTASNLSAGTYSVTATDANGCTATATVTITEPTSLSASITVDSAISCYGYANGVAHAVGTGGTTPYGYAWSFGATNDSVSGVDTGTHVVTITDANGCTATASVTFTQPDLLIANAMVINHVSCFGGVDGSAYATQTGGTGPFTYAWTVSSSNDSIFNLSANTYEVTITDANGCSATDTVDILEPTQLSLNVTITDPSCNGGSDGSITTTMSGGNTPYTYLWSTGATTADLTGIPAGSYTVTVTDANGCTAAINPIVSQPDTIEATFTSTSVDCNGNSTGMLVVNAGGGTSPYSYNWSNSGTNDTIENVPAGTYFVTITDANGCTNIFSASVTEPSAVVASIAFTDSVDCAGDSTGMVIASASGGTPGYAYAWPSGFPSSNDTLFNVPAGNYTVTVTDNNGCVDSVTATVFANSEVIASITSVTSTTCEFGNDGQATASVTGGSGPYSYAWANGATGSNPTNLEPGFQCVTITDANGCSDTACFTLNFINAAPVVDLGNDTALCDSSKVLDAGNGGVNYMWNTSQSGQVITVSTTGNYVVTVTDINGCQNSDDITVVFNTPVNYELIVDSTTCGSSNGVATIINLTGGGSYSIQWSNGGFGSLNLTGLAYGAYSVTVSDGAGCSNEQDFFVYNQTDLEVQLNTSAAACFGGSDGYITATTTGGSGNISYLWSNGSTNDSLINVPTGMYSVTATDNAGCFVIDSTFMTQPDQILFNLTTLNADCGNTNGYAAVSNVQPSGSYTYQWNDPNLQTTDTAFNLAAGVYEVTITSSIGCSDSAYAIVSNVGGPSLSMAAQNEVCAGGGDGFATVAASGSSPFSYQWNDGASQTTDTAFALTAGLYFVSVEDNNGCITIDSISINSSNPIPVVDLGADGLVCATSHELNAGAGFASYLWNTGSTDSTITITSSGVFSITVSNAAGCENQDTIDVTMSDPVGFTANVNTSSCVFSTGGVDLTMTSGTSPYTFVWSNGATTEDLIGVSSGAYFVTIVDDAGCSSVDTFNVTNFNPPILGFFYDNVTCNGGADGEITSNINGGTYPFQFDWNNGSTDSINSNLSVGTYILTVVDDSGCIAIDSITLTQPTPIMMNFSFTQPDCGDSNGNILTVVTNSQGPIVSYLWSDANATTLPYVENLTAGLYTVTVTDSAGCVKPQSVALSNTGAPVLAVTSTMNNCSNENSAYAAVYAIGDEPLSYLWNDPMNQANDTAYNLYNGSYAVSVSDTNNCIAIGTTDITSLFVSPTVDLGEDISECQGTEVIVTPGSGYQTYFWSTGSFLPAIIASGSDTYFVTVTNSQGCSARDSVIVDFVAPPVIDLGIDTVICVEDTGSFALDAGAGFNFYEWSTGATTQTIDVNSTGLYRVTVSNIPGCEGSDDRIVVVDTCVNVTVDEVAGIVAEVKLYPNPNRGQFVLETDGLPQGDYDLRLYNGAGQQVTLKQLIIQHGIQSRTEFDLGSTGKGVYLLSIEGKDVRMRQTIIVQ